MPPLPRYPHSRLRSTGTIRLPLLDLVEAQHVSQAGPERWRPARIPPSLYLRCLRFLRSCFRVHPASPPLLRPNLCLLVFRASPGVLPLLLSLPLRRTAARTENSSVGSDMCSAP